MLVTSIFSFSQNVFKNLFAQGLERLGLCDKELNVFIISMGECNTILSACTKYRHFG